MGGEPVTVQVNPKATTRVTVTPLTSGGSPQSPAPAVVVKSPGPPGPPGPQGIPGPKGDDKVFVGLLPPDPRGTYEVWVKAQPPT